MFHLRDLLKEVGRRHVARVAVVYAAVAFAFLEAADIVIPALGLPPWTIRWVIALALLGFPVAILLAWVYDVTPRGVIRTRSLEEGEGEGEEHGRPLLSAVLLILSGVLLAGGVWFTYEWSLSTAQAPDSSTTVPADSLNPLRIAVLPFANLSPSEEDDGFFASGIHEDILGNLAKIRSLEVISRQTVLQYRDTTLTAREIGRDLRAGSILEGTVRKEGDRILVSAQLIDARSDSHIWSERYDREESDVFLVQSEIAQEIASALRAELTSQERARLEAASTTRGPAYRRYARGLSQWDLRENRQNALRAVELFREATEEDPDLARAYAALSQARMWLFWNFPGFQDQAEPAREALDRAMELAPEAVETILAQGYFHFWGRGDARRALAHFAEAEEAKPSDASVIAAKGLVLRVQGEWDEAVEEFLRARNFNPRSYNLNYTVGETLLRMRRYGEAERYLRMAGELAPDMLAAHEDLLRARLASTGDTVAARRVMEELPDSMPSPVRDQLERNLAYYRGDLTGALSPERGFGPRYLERNAILHRLLGQEERARSLADSLRMINEEVLEAASENPGPVQSGVEARAHAKLGIAYAFLGEEIQAQLEGETAVSLLPISMDAYEGGEHLRDLAVIYVLIGEPDLALLQLRTALSIPSPITPTDLLLDPVFDSIRDEPAFQELLAEQAL